MYESIRQPDLNTLLQAGDSEALRAYLALKKPADIADAAEHLSHKDIRTLLAALDSALKGETFNALDIDLQLAASARMDSQQLADLLVSASTDDAARLLGQLGRRRREAVLACFAKSEREAVAQLAAFDADSAGANASARYAVLSPDMRASDALARLRADAGQAASIYVAYVVDADRKLLGVVELADLLTAPARTETFHLMDSHFVSAFADEDQEVAAERVRKYGLLSLPVIARDGRLVGTLTQHDAAEILEDERREDADRFAALADRTDDVPYLRVSVFSHFRRRVGWVLGLAALGLVSGYILHVYEDVIAALVILALYIPTIADTGGNVGTQSSSLIVRGLALGEVSVRDTGRVLAKEFGVSLMLAGILFVFAVGKVLFLSNAGDLPGGITLFNVGLAVGLAIAIQVIVATLMGAMLPLGAKMIRQDPALVAGPALTTLVDITGLFIYFRVCTYLFDLH